MGFKWMDIGFWSSNKFCLSLCLYEENKIFSHFHQMLPWMLRETKRENTWQILSFISAAAPIKEMSEFIIKRNNKSLFILYFAIAYLIVSAFGIKIKLVNILAAEMAINNFWKMLFLAIYSLNGQTLNETQFVKILKFCSLFYPQLSSWWESGLTLASVQLWWVKSFQDTKSVSWKWIFCCKTCTGGAVTVHGHAEPKSPTGCPLFLIQILVFPPIFFLLKERIFLDSL